MQVKASRRGSVKIEPTLIDRVVNYAFPTLGLQRMKARALLTVATGLQGGYESGKRSRRATKRWRPTGQSADADIIPDLPDLRARSRDLARNNPISSGAIATNVTSIVGDGLMLQASIDPEPLGITPERADEMEREQEREWDLFCKSLDFTRGQHADELQTLLLRSALESGDVFGVRRYRRDPGDVYGTKLQVVEADRCSNPERTPDTLTLVAGVEVDSDGVHTGYHFADRFPGPIAKEIKWTRVPARDRDGRVLVIHLFDRLRADQTRGVPYLAPVIEHLKQLSTYSEAEVMSAVVSAMFTLAIEEPEGADTEDEQPSFGDRRPDDESNEVGLGAGAILSLNAGQKPHVVNPGRPNAQFDPFVQAFLRQVGVALELPFELLIKHFTASYSASRAALEMAWQFFRKRRSWLGRRVMDVLYEWMMEEACAGANPRLVRPGYFENPILRQAYLGANWIGPVRASIDPLKESNADKQDIELGVKTREQVCMERTGGEIERKAAQLVKEDALLAGRAKAPAPPGGPQTPPPPVDDAGDSDDDTEDETRRSRA
ncbi:MAG: phage portal protein [Pseudorhodoplanes sp.]|uniref:phage portal protein n=1 Tax=Pseudorhodoplanes sp. TaxID=1934341 RepID=UPI003D0F71C6